MKYYPKKIYSMEELKAEPVTYKTLGGLEAMLKLGMQNQKNIDISQQLYEHSFGAGKKEGKEVGFVQGKNLGFNQGYTSGVKEFMLKGNKYVVLHKDSSEPVMTSNVVDALNSEVGGRKINAFIADKNLGKTFEESPRYQEAIKIQTEEILKERGYQQMQQDLEAELINDDIAILQQKIKDVDQEVDRMKLKQKKLYEKERKQYLSGKKTQSFLTDIGGATKIPFILTDDWHLYNTEGLRKYTSKNSEGLDPLIERAKVLDFRTNATPINSPNISDYIFYPGPQLGEDLQQQMKQKSEKAKENVAQFLLTHKIETPLTKEYQEKQKQNLKRIPMGSLDHDIFAQTKQLLKENITIERKVNRSIQAAQDFILVEPEAEVTDKAAVILVQMQRLEQERDDLIKSAIDLAKSAPRRGLGPKPYQEPPSPAKITPSKKIQPLSPAHYKPPMKDEVAIPHVLKSKQKQPPLQPNLNQQGRDLKKKGSKR